jgi:hypothetical protein
MSRINEFSPVDAKTVIKKIKMEKKNRRRWTRICWTAVSKTVCY